MSTMPLGRRKRADEIAEHIERAISTGEFKEGAPMPSEKELAERFGVGRPSVRQALFTLQQQGLVEITSGTRARVTAPSGKFLTGQLASSDPPHDVDGPGPGTYGADPPALRSGRGLAGRPRRHR